jgi:amidophosphoribosyltransferase
MCGIVGIYSHQRVAEELYDSLIHLQHRGQDAAGALTCQERFDVKHGLGLVREIFNDRDVMAMQGNIGIGHTRYPTAGGYAISDAQPMWIGSPRGIALAHNGNLLNYKELAKDIIQKKHRHLNSSTDSEVLLHLLADGLNSTPDTWHDDTAFFNTICEAVQSVFDQAKGSFSIVSVMIGKGLLAFRDPHGIRPLVMGARLNPDGTNDYIMASEPTMFYALGFQPMGDVQPGEVIFINQDGQLFRKMVQQKKFSPCIFEYVYFARPDSTLDGVNVYRARLRMGQNLAIRWKEKHPDLIPDVVIPAPSTANTAALSFAHELGIRYSEGLYKNPFIGRTFIMPDGKERRRQVCYKLTPQPMEIKNKKVLILDDSIVRGNTSLEIVKMLREFGAKAVYFASSCPPITHPCYYGIDIPSTKELIAANHTPEEIRDYLNVDQLLYQSADDLVEAVTRKGDHHIKTPCMACMNGQYITGDINQSKAKQLKNDREHTRGAL